MLHKDLSQENLFMIKIVTPWQHETVTKISCKCTNIDNERFFVF